MTEKHLDMATINAFCDLPQEVREWWQFQICLEQMERGDSPDPSAYWLAMSADQQWELVSALPDRYREYLANQSNALVVGRSEFSDIKKALAKPHMLILGETGSGKSTLVKYLVSQSSAPSLVLDPHAAPDDWQGMKVIGAGRKYREIGDEVNRLVKLMDGRYDDRSNGQKNFIPLVVIIDEFPAIAASLGKTFTEQVMLLVREARKVAIKLVILSQGAEVKTLGIDGQGSIRECFAIISIGKFATARAKSLGDDAIKSALSASKYPAMLDDLPCALPEIDRVNLPSLPLPPDYQELLTSTSTNTNTYNPISPLVRAPKGLPDLQGCTYTYESPDFELARKCKTLVEAGKPTTWIVENVLGCKGRNFAQGKQRLAELLSLCQL